MTQTKEQSLAEAVTNTGLAFCINVIVMWAILPLYHPGNSFQDSFEIVLIFTVISVLRGYAIRRFFDSKQSTPAISGHDCSHGRHWEDCPECRHP